MRIFVENLHILLLVNSETLLTVAEGKPGSGLGTRSQCNCTKTTGGRMQITSAVEPHRLHGTCGVGRGLEIRAEVRGWRWPKIGVRSTSYVGFFIESPKEQ